MEKQEQIDTITKLLKKIVSNNVVRFGMKSTMEFLPFIGGIINNAIDEQVPDEAYNILKALKEATEKDFEEIKENLLLNENEMESLRKNSDINKSQIKAFEKLIQENFEILMLIIENYILKLKLEQVEKQIIKKPNLEIRDVKLVTVMNVQKRKKR